MIGKKKVTSELLRKNYYRSALPKSLGPSAPIKKFEQYRSEHDIKITSVLDFGAGNQRDKEFCLERYGKYIPHDISGRFEIKQPKEILERHYDLVIFNYILNVVIPEDREDLVKKIKEYLLKDSIILLAVRTVQQKREIKDNWIEYKDGWVTTRLTFQHFFTEKEIYSSFQNDSLKIIDLKRGTYVLI